MNWLTCSMQFGMCVPCELMGSWRAAYAYGEDSAGRGLGSGEEGAGMRTSFCWEWKETERRGTDVVDVLSAFCSAGILSR